MQSVSVRWMLGCTDLHDMVTPASGHTLGEHLSFCRGVLLPQSYRLSSQVRENRGVEQFNAAVVQFYGCEGHTKCLVSAAS